MNLERGFNMTNGLKPEDKPEEMPEEMHGDMQEDNPVTTKWEIKDKILIKKEIHEKPVEIVTTWDIDEERKKVIRYMRIAKMWEDKCISPQQKIDEYEKQHKKLE